MIDTDLITVTTFKRFVQISKTDSHAEDKSKNDALVKKLHPMQFPILTYRCFLVSVFLDK